MFPPFVKHNPANNGAGPTPRGDAIIIASPPPPPPDVNSNFGYFATLGKTRGYWGYGEGLATRTRIYTTGFLIYPTSPRAVPVSRDESGRPDPVFGAFAEIAISRQPPTCRGRQSAIRVASDQTGRRMRPCERGRGGGGTDGEAHSGGGGAVSASGRRKGRRVRCGGWD